MIEDEIFFLRHGIDERAGVDVVAQLIRICRNAFGHDLRPRRIGCELEGNIEELLNSLDLKELQNYLDSLSEFNGISVKDKLKSVITGDFALDYTSLGKSIIALVWDEMTVLLPAFAVILAISLLCGILNSAKNGFLNSTMTDIIEFVGFITVLPSLL